MGICQCCYLGMEVKSSINAEIITCCKISCYFLFYFGWNIPGTVSVII